MLGNLFAPMAMKVAGGLVALLLLALGVQTWRLQSSVHAEAATRAELRAERAASALFAERVRAKSEAISRKAAEAARNVENRQNEISQEVSRDYQTKLDALRRRYDALRVRPGTGGANPGGGGNAVPGIPAPAGGPDAAAAPDLFACEANSLQLGELQRWFRGQQAVKR